MFKQLIVMFTCVIAQVFGASDAASVEKQLETEIFGPKWGLDTNESNLLLTKLQIAKERSDYPKILLDFYNLAKTIEPKPFNPSQWHDDEDAVAAEPTHQVFIENAYVRILEVVIPPGGKQAYHTHKWAGITVDLISSDFVLTNDDGQFPLLATDDPVWHHDEGQPLHTVTNVGNVTYMGLHFELKN